METIKQLNDEIAEKKKALGDAEWRTRTSEWALRSAETLVSDTQALIASTKPPADVHEAAELLLHATSAAVRARGIHESATREKNALDNRLGYLANRLERAEAVKRELEERGEHDAAADLAGEPPPPPFEVPAPAPLPADDDVAF